MTPEETDKLIEVLTVRVQELEHERDSAIETTVQLLTDHHERQMKGFFLETIVREVFKDHLMSGKPRAKLKIPDSNPFDLRVTVGLLRRARTALGIEIPVDEEAKED